MKPKFMLLGVIACASSIYLVLADDESQQQRHQLADPRIVLLKQKVTELANRVARLERQQAANNSAAWSTAETTGGPNRTSTGQPDLLPRPDEGVDEGMMIDAIEFRLRGAWTLRSSL